MIKDNLLEIKNTLPEHVTLVAVSKTKPDEDVMEAYTAGERIFGENKVQEMVGKWERLPKDIKWHMIGHLQRNKVKYMAEFVDLVHGVDSFKLLSEINKRAQQHNRTIDCLLQIHIAEEDTKFGLDKDELDLILKSDEYLNLKNVNVVGLMGMATFTNNKEQIRREFQQLKSIFDSIKSVNPRIKILSMGMSGDYQVAIEEGSTMVRIGSSIFGKRNYK
ncbi:YggS family pyridoxal phosphate-dependent enzyme [Zobellia roscoffensis]|uniref:YggS family pyridoxal phosphate-dependent enzyme n=1 Tax=Zobellia roscoffensis TaxID=2779508 RepID=UPI00188C8455|nr:YggS family pyridoxal phosphate-dependent enzyme [Zobellia roscoffensis]